MPLRRTYIYIYIYILYVYYMYIYLPALDLVEDDSDVCVRVRQKVSCLAMLRYGVRAVRVVCVSRA